MSNSGFQDINLLVKAVNRTLGQSPRSPIDSRRHPLNDISSVNAQATNMKLDIRRTKNEFDIANFDGHAVLEQVLDDRTAVDGCAVSALEVENHVSRL